MRRWILPLLLVVAAVWAWRTWSDAPPPALPAEVWVRAPFRGPAVHSAPAADAKVDASLLPLTAEPPLEHRRDQRPDERVWVCPTQRFDRRIGVYLGWRPALPPVADVTPAVAASWGVRSFRFSGRTESVDDQVVWAHYEREDGPPRK